MEGWDEARRAAGGLLHGMLEHLRSGRLPADVRVAIVSEALYQQGAQGGQGAHGALASSLASSGPSPQPTITNQSAAVHRATTTAATAAAAVLLVRSLLLGEETLAPSPLSLR